ncbi:MAG: hypothetical protein V1684_01905 [bacterium]
MMTKISPGPLEIKIFDSKGSVIKNLNFYVQEKNDLGTIGMMVKETIPEYKDSESLFFSFRKLSLGVNRKVEFCLDVESSIPFIRRTGLDIGGV